jgi:hypothetical protein
MRTARRFRESFVYSTWNYCLIQLIAEKVTGKPFGQIMKEKILDPLGMNDSSFEIPKGGNVMTPHAVRNDGTVFRNIPVDTFDSEKGLSAVMGGKISLHDILKMYSDMLRAYRHQKHNSTDTTPGSPFVQLREIFNKHIPLTKEISCSQHYCLGTYRTSLPGNLSYASYNAFLLQNKTPVFEDSRPGTIVYHHTGNKAGYFSSMFLVPETQSGVVCFTNATPLMDPTDLCSQIYLSVLLGSKSKVDHISLAKTAAAAQLKMYNGTSSYIQRKKTDIPPTLPLSSYAGTYINDAQNFSLIVRVNRSTTGLQVSIQNSLLTTYDLLPWDRDTFYWEVDWEREICEKGMFPVPIPVMHLRSFGVAGKAAESLKWRHEMLVKDPEVFQRVDSKEKGEL